MAVAHQNLTGADRHEPKDIETATLDQLYVSDGAGSGTWTDTSTVVASTSRIVGEVFAFAGLTVPALSLFCFGQDVSRTTYSALFTAIGTNWGIGDGSTTFGLPDLRDRVIAGQGDMGGTPANRLTSPLDGDTFAATGGLENATLVQANLPNLNFAVNDPGHLHGIVPNALQDAGGAAGGAVGRLGSSSTVPLTQSASTGITVASGGSDTPVNVVQPTAIMNWCIFTGV